ncbi:MAG TPA: tetratricopeptide repeat protein, partial [Kofleriaceae bacterium]|nr:tetratricopeptide repeat protein [Kofleriaceae bacterium]
MWRCHPSAAGSVLACALAACSGGSAPPRAQSSTPSDGAPAAVAADLAVEEEPLETAPPPPVPEPEPAPAPEPGAIALSETMAAPYFDSGAAEAAADRFALEDWEAARAGFTRVLRGKPRPEGEDRARVELMIALCDAQLGHHGQAAKAFARAVGELPALSDWLHYQAAYSYFQTRDMGRALEHARKVAADSIQGADAELLAGDILRGRGSPGEIADHYRKYLADRPDGYRMSEARFRLAEARERQPDGADEALSLYRKNTVVAPISRWAVASRQRIAAILSRRSASERASFEQLSAAELVKRGMVYFDNMRNKE